MNGFEDLMILLRLLGDPEAYKARLQELQSASEALEAHIAETNSAALALETKRSELTAQAAALREREVKVHGEELKFAADRTEIDRWRRDQRASRLVAVGPGGLTHERDDTPDNPDPISDPFAESMTPPAAVRAAPRHKSRARG